MNLKNPESLNLCKVDIVPFVLSLQVYYIPEISPVTSVLRTHWCGGHSLPV